MIQESPTALARRMLESLPWRKSLSRVKQDELVRLIADTIDESIVNEPIDPDTARNLFALGKQTPGYKGNVLPSGTNVWHRTGCWWHEAPIPRRWHRCKPWTIGVDTTGCLVERCACGALRRNHSAWIGRNDRLWTPSHRRQSPRDSDGG